MGTSNAKTLNLQDSFLNKVRAEKKTIVIYLLNGFQVRGKVWGFDNFTAVSYTHLSPCVRLPIIAR